jgi:hypothetical protein
MILKKNKSMVIFEKVIWVSSFVSQQSSLVTQIIATGEHISLKVPLNWTKSQKKYIHIDLFFQIIPNNWRKTICTKLITSLYITELINNENFVIPPSVSTETSLKITNLKKKHYLAGVIIILVWCSECLFCNKCVIWPSF